MGIPCRLLLVVGLIIVLSQLGTLVLAEKRSKEQLGVDTALAQLDWLRSKGGYYNDKVSIDPIFIPDDEDAYVPLGLFALQDIQEGETLMKIPRKCLLTTGPYDSEDICDTALNLIRERRLKEESEFAPYVNYVYSKNKVPLPSSWSDTAKRMINKIRGNNLPPFDLTEVSFENSCLEEYDAEEDEVIAASTISELNFAYLTVVSRAWTDKLVPVFDMINHHSGRYANVDSSLVHGDQDITVHATRNIPAGEQLFLSYMDCIDERGYENDYVLPQLLRDFGYVDGYPQRWTFPVNGEDLVFDLDFINEEADALYKSGTLKFMPEMNLHWRTDPPDDAQKLVLKRELRRVEKLESFVKNRSKLIDDEYEKYVTEDYYRSLYVALQYATGMNVTLQNTCNVAEGCDKYDLSSSGGLYAESLSRTKSAGIIIPETPVEPQQGVPGPETPENKQKMAQETDGDEWMACDDYESIPETYDELEDYGTSYQNVEIYESKAKGDACLYLDSYLHTCASSRAHYHEVFVHYPARFLDQLKRVIFIGGGDSMVLHEVMKYNTSLELVVGLELDQKVVRTSFHRFGTMPFWDNEKVQWYFGDAAKILNILPENYYGSFDLVVVDILSDIAEVLQVNDEYSVMDAAYALMSPDGIIIKNEDQGYIPGSKPLRTKYSLDLAYHDVPLYCLQVFVAGSNAVDFLVATPKDHGIATLYLEGLEEFRDQFDSWYNYGQQSTKTSSLKLPDNNNTASLRAVTDFGVLMILEAEMVNMSSVPETGIETSIRQPLSTEVNISVVDVIFGNTTDGFVQIILFQEGYIKAKCTPAHQYCAFDIQMYGPFVGQLEKIKKVLLSAVGSRNSSSYCFVTSGMTGITREVSILSGPPPKGSVSNSKSDGADNLPPGKQLRKEKRKDEFDSPKAFTLQDFHTNTEALSQWKSQQQIGSQALLHLNISTSPFWIGEKVYVVNRDEEVYGTIVGYRGAGLYNVRFDRNAEKDFVLKDTMLQKASGVFDRTLATQRLIDLVGFVLKAAGEQAKNGYTSESMLMTECIGDGVSVAIIWPGGDVVATWDGKFTIEINIFFHSNDSPSGDVFEEVEFNENFLGLTIIDVDDFPRGLGRLVSFEQDITEEQPIWA